MKTVSWLEAVLIGVFLVCCVTFAVALVFGVWSLPLSIALRVALTAVVVGIAAVVLLSVVN